jgi:hypothetical protein
MAFTEETDINVDHKFCSSNQQPFFSFLTTSKGRSPIAARTVLLAPSASLNPTVAVDAHLFAECEEFFRVKHLYYAVAEIDNRFSNVFLLV